MLSRIVLLIYRLFENFWGFLEYLVGFLQPVVNYIRIEEVPHVRRISYEKMVKGNTFNFEISLQRFSAVAAAIYIWEKPDLKKEIRNFFSKYSGGDEDKYSFQELYDKWKAVEEFSLKHVRGLDLNLPKNDMAQLEAAVVYISDKIFDWVSYTVKLNHFDIKYANQIYWTLHGTVDDGKILRSFWAKDPKFPGWSDADVDHQLLRIAFYNTCSVYAEVDTIMANKEEVLDILSYFYGKQIKKKKHTPFEIMAMIFCYVFSQGNGKTPPGMYDEVMKGRQMSPAASLFSGAVSASADRAVKYFCEKLTKKERDELLHKIASAQLFKVVEINKIGNNHKKERLAAVILYLLNNMTKEQQDWFLVERGVEACKIFLTIPPYDTLVLPILKSFWHDIDKKNYFFMKDEMLKFTFKCLKNFSPSAHPSRKEIMQELFGHLLNMTPKDTKIKVIVKERFSYISKLFHLHDLVTLGFILSDRDLAASRNKILALGTEIFQELLDKGEFDYVDKFFQKIQLTDVEKKKLKTTLKITSDAVINGKVELAEKLLNWLSNSPEEKQELKNQIDPVEICSGLIGAGLYSSTKKYLTWQLGKDHDSFFLELKSKILPSKLCQIWCREFVKGNAKAKCNELIKFLSADNNAEMIEDDEELIRIFFEEMPSPDCARMIDELLLFCLKSSDRIQRVKAKIAADIDSWIESFSLNQEKFLVAKAVVDWLLQKSKKTAAIRNFINSRKGARLCVEVIKSKDERTIPVVASLYNNWVRPYGDVTKIRNHIHDVYGENSATGCVQGAKYLLAKVKKGKTITLDHAKYYMDIKSPGKDEGDSDAEDDLASKCAQS